MSDELKYSEEQAERLEQDAYNAAMLEAGKEWEHERGVSGEREAALEERNADLVAFIERLIEAGGEIVDEAQLQEPDVSELREAWQALVAEWRGRNDRM